MRATQEDAEAEEGEEDAAEGAAAADGDEGEDEDLSPLLVFFQIEVVLLRVIYIGLYSQKGRLVCWAMQSKVVLMSGVHPPEVPPWITL